jgi:hypothetical protein
MLQGVWQQLPGPEAPLGRVYRHAVQGLSRTGRIFMPGALSKHPDVQAHVLERGMPQAEMAKPGRLRHVLRDALRQGGGAMGIPSAGVGLFSPSVIKQNSPRIGLPRGFLPVAVTHEAGELIGLREGASWRRAVRASIGPGGDLIYPMGHVSRQVIYGETKAAAMSGYRLGGAKGAREAVRASLGWRVEAGKMQMLSFGGGTGGIVGQFQLAQEETEVFARRVLRRIGTAEPVVAAAARAPAGVVATTAARAPRPHIQFSKNTVHTGGALLALGFGAILLGALVRGRRPPSAGPQRQPQYDEGQAGYLQSLHNRMSGTPSKIVRPQAKYAHLIPSRGWLRPQPGANLGARREGRGAA